MIESQPDCASTHARAPSHARALRAAAPTRLDKDALSSRLAASRGRKGVVGQIPSVWRRCSMGTNRISCIGVWRTGTRREAVRANRMGATDWHRPYRSRPQAKLCTAADVS